MAATKPMNVLHVISDQHIAGCLGAEGHAQAITPNMDRLAAKGVRFRHAYTQNPICTPSRMSILSGQYCHNHGFFGLGGPTPRELPSFLQHFKQNNYLTAAIGKLHMPNRPADWLLEHVHFWADSYHEATEENFINDVGSRQSAYFRYLSEKGLRDKEDSVIFPEFDDAQKRSGHGDARPSNLQFHDSVEGWCVQEACRFIDGCGDMPFCMQVSLPRPHTAHTPDQNFWDMYPDDLDLPETFYDDPSSRPPMFQNQVEGYKNHGGAFEPSDFESRARRVWHGYLACITQVDHALGLLMDHLEKIGEADNTIVIYHSDHGAYSGHFGIVEKAPGICSESVCRVPFIWHVPNVTKVGHVCNELVENIDIAATITQLCDLPAMTTTDGHDITELLQGSTQPVRNVAVTEHPWSKSARWEQWRLVHYQSKMYPGQDYGELYDIHQDPFERNNLYNDPKYQTVVNQGRRLLLEWLIDTTRCKTVWPTLDWPQMTYDIAADGKESNTAGAKARIKAGMVNYI